MILVVGDACTDIYKIALNSRWSPEDPSVRILSNFKSEARSGMGKNVRENIIDLGGEAKFVGMNRGEKERVIFDNKQIVRMDRDTTYPITKEEENILIDTIWWEIRRANIVIISDYGKGTCTERVIKETIQMAATRIIRVLVDPYKTTPPEWYQGAFLIKENIRDGINYDPYTKHVVTTLGADGMIYGGFMIEAETENAVDVTGAGDTVIAALAVGIADGMTVLEATRFASRAAGVVVQKFGTATCSLEELKETK
jgi:bifunctional ADP-heptose synthase (sugar kinase/adenylyltransferase)